MGDGGIDPRFSFLDDVDYLQRNPVDLVVLALQLGIHVHGHVPQVVDDAAHLL